MEEILQKARELAELIKNSDLFKASKAAEKAAYADARAVGHVSDYYAKEQAIRALLSNGPDVDAEALAKAGEALEAAQAAMENDPLVVAMQEANKACNEVLTAVSQILSEAIESDRESGCTGSCGTCGSCGACGARN